MNALPVTGYNLILAIWGPMWIIGGLYLTHLMHAALSMERVDLAEREESDQTLAPVPARVTNVVDAGRAA